MSGGWGTCGTPALQRRQEDWVFKTRLGYIRPCFKTIKKQQQIIHALWHSSGLNNRHSPGQLALLKFISSLFYFMCTSALPACVSVHNMDILPSEARIGFRLPWESSCRQCEPPCRCWELNLGPLEGQSVLWTAEPSLQLPCFIFLKQQSKC